MYLRTKDSLIRMASSRHFSSALWVADNAAPLSITLLCTALSPAPSKLPYVALANFPSQTEHSNMKSLAVLGAPAGCHASDLAELPNYTQKLDESTAYTVQHSAGSSSVLPLKEREDGNKGKRLLSDAQETRLLKRLHYLWASRRYSNDTAEYGCGIIGRTPSTRWAIYFIKRHSGGFLSTMVEELEKLRHAAEFVPGFERCFDRLNQGMGQDGTGGS